MIRIVALGLIILFSCKAKKNNTSDVVLYINNIKPSCWKDRIYNTESDSLKVIEYNEAPFECGVRMSSVSLLCVNTQNDTIQLFEICGKHKIIKENSYVSCLKQNEPKNEFSIFSHNPSFDCRYKVLFCKVIDK
jgi:hypothetical protein